MRRFLVPLLAMAAVAGLANLAMAGDYHVGRLLVCSDCHTPHGSMAHGFGTDADTTWQGEPTPHPFLLRGETVNNACLNCHDGKTGIPDVLQVDANSTPNGRSAGALNVVNGGAHGVTQVSPYSQGEGHTLFSTDVPPGGTTAYPPISATAGLECSDCHKVHGSKYFRNLLGDVTTGTATFFSTLWRGKEVTYEIGAAPSTGSTAWVLEKAAHTYGNDNVQYLEPDQTRSGYGEWCQTCHNEFHGNLTSTNISDLAGEVVRHPTAGVNLSVNGWKVPAPNANHRLKVMDATATWDANTTMTPSCFTCHKSHGNANRFGLIFVLPNRSTNPATGGPTDPKLLDPTRVAMTEEGDGGEYRDLCRNCHGMGSWPTGNPINILP